VEAYRAVVHGTAQRSVAPDVAMLSLRIVELDEDQRAAFARCRARVGTIVPQLQALLDGDDRVTTGNLSVERDYDEFEERPERLYEASCPIVVTCRPDVAAQAISEAIAAGVDRLSGPRFSVRDRAPVIEDLLGTRPQLPVDPTRLPQFDIGESVKRFGTQPETQAADALVDFLFGS
jgi:uncharacterized protein YggE